MVLAGVTVFLVVVQAIALLQQPCCVSGDFLSPFLSPVLNGLCKAVYCGKGTCKVSENSTLGFSCQCNPGWTQFHVEDHFRFLPCLIPNCSINYSCAENSGPLSPAPFPAPPDNFTLFDPCTWSFCGGGECVRSSTFEHRCECRKGYNNLLNVSSFPCYKECSIGADCSNLGISLTNSSSSPSSQPSLSDNGNSSAGDHHALNNLLWLVTLVISLGLYDGRGAPPPPPPSIKRRRRDHAREDTTQLDQPPPKVHPNIASLHGRHRAAHLNTSVVLEVSFHLLMQKEWSITCPRFTSALHVVGLDCASQMHYICLDHHLLTALVERWSP